LRAIVLDAVNPELRFCLGEALFRAGSFETALDWLEPLAAKGYAPIDVLRGKILADMRQGPEALQAYRVALEEDPDSIDARLQLSAVLIETGDADRSIKELDRVLSTQPSNTRGLTLHAMALLEMGNPEAALEKLDVIDDSELTAEHVLLRARAELLREKPAARVDKILAKGVEDFPSDVRLQLAFARTLASRRASDPQASGKAIGVLEKLVDEHGGVPSRQHTEALNLLAELYSERPDGYQRAETCYHRVLSVRPDDASALAGMGSLLLEQGRPSHALPWLLHSLVVDPERPRTVENLAKAICSIPDDEAVARWLGLVSSALPEQAPMVLAQLVRYVQEAGRTDAYEEVRREGHRMKNLVAVLANRLAANATSKASDDLDRLYKDWEEFLERIRLPSPKPSTFSAADLVRRAVSEAAESPERIKLKLPPGLPLIKGDAEQLFSALVNIIRNAVQVSPPDKAVRVAARCKPGSGWIEFVIVDEGPGIPIAEQRRIFDPGFSAREKGTGLGLSIARRAIMVHGGRISVASASGGPTTFTVRLPTVSGGAPSHLFVNPVVTFDNPLGKKRGSGRQMNPEGGRHGE